MALRVLLADESTTIKKVMQLALQDFAVEVKSIHSGVDALEVAHSFSPDIVFADVLLQKKNGYEVSADLKNDPNLRDIPVVLMWSSFMELDEKLAQISNADRRLEKPFDVESLRQLVLELVPKTRSQRLAHFLKFPESFAEPLKSEEQERATSPHHKPKAPASPSRARAPGATPDIEATMRIDVADVDAAEAAEAAETAATADAHHEMSLETEPLPPEAPHGPSKWSMESFDDISSFAPDPQDEKSSGHLRSVQPPEAGHAEIHLDDAEPETPLEVEPDDDEVFQEMRLGSQPPPNYERGDAPQKREPRQAPRPQAKTHDESDPWSHQDLSRFKIELPDDHEDGDLEIEIPEIDDHAPMTLEANSRYLSDEEGPTKPLELTDFEHDEAPPVRRPSGDRRPAAAAQTPMQMNPAELEALIRAQSHDIIADLVRKIVPDLATTLIREELHRLLANEDELAGSSGARNAQPKPHSKRP